jgi:hypothetical protein
LDTELILIVGVVVAVMSIPAIISAFGASRPPRAATVTAVIGGALIVFAISQHPGGFRAQDLPEITARVIDRYLN